MQRGGLMAGRGRKDVKSVDNKRIICKDVSTVRGAREQVLVAALGTPGEVLEDKDAAKRGGVNILKGCWTRSKRERQ